ncbi:DUF448 domain-containing protein [Candidatus Poribacteria bacterium]|nr:DUF448 domain-containing protein [Candidatus Poribacteria bacterium]
MPLPQRTCIGCHRIKLKQDLIKLVFSPYGELVLDKRKKMGGRGAYVCPSKSCINKAMQTERLKRAFRVDPEMKKFINQESVRRIKQSLLALIC